MISTTAEAPAQTAGFVFQLRYALLRAIERARRDATGFIGVERVDDIILGEGDTVDSVEQTKHSTGAQSSFTDYSPAIWKTVGNWSRLILLGLVDAAKVEFVFVTNATIPDDSAFGKLQPDGREPGVAWSILLGAANASLSKTTEADRAEFKSLTDVQQLALVSAIRIATTVGLPDLTTELQTALHYICEPNQLGDLVSELEGWWLQRLSQDLGKGTGAILALTELESRISYLREKYKSSTLPIDFEEPVDDLATLNEYTFVKQLKIVDVSSPRILNAQRDFLRARAQRSKWIREARVDPAEIDNYDAALFDHWRTRFLIMADEFREETVEIKKQHAGRGLLNWAETQSVPLRGAHAQFLTSGSYHALADEVRVGWHPDYETRFSSK